MYGHNYDTVYNTALVTKPIGDPLEASRYIDEVEFSGDTKRVPMVLTPSRMACSMTVCIPEGFRALVASHGKFLTIWGPGFYFAPPWYSITHLVGLQHFVYDTPVKSCPTSDNVMVTIDVTLVFHVDASDDTLQQFAFRLGPEGLDDMLQQVQQDSVRAMVRKRKYFEIYDLMNAAHDEALKGTMKELNASFKDYGVIITAMTVTNVHLPASIADDMQKTTIYHNQEEFHDLEQQHQLLVIENDEKEKKEAQAMREKLEQFEADCKKRLAVERAKYQLIKAETKRILSEIKEQENADIKTIDANANLSSSEIERKRDVELATIKAKGEAEAEQMRVETRAYQTETLAEADRVVAERNAEALTISADAEDQSAQLLVAKRSYQEKMRQLQVIQGLAENPDVSLSGNNNDNYVSQLLSSGRQAAIMGVNRM